MNRYFIELSFRGTHYHGWQLQPNATSVQALIEEALLKLVRKNIKTTGATIKDVKIQYKMNPNIANQVAWIDRNFKR